MGELREQMQHELVVLRAIARCRTAALGGHVEACETCGAECISYNSCRNRHCPKCQGAARAKWLAAEQALLLPAPYFHVVFTLPHLLNPLVRVNQRALYTLLFQAAAQTLQAFARAPTHLGAEIGLTAVLHTWGQTLTEHIHVHCIVTGGGLTAEGTQWRACRRRFLFAVKALSQVFRGKYLAGLTRLRAQHQLHFVAASATLAEDQLWTAFLGQVHRTRWVVYAKPPWGGPQQVLKYLSCYTHRVAIANARLICVGDGVVRFRYKDYAAGGTTKVMELRAEEFLRRFLLHVVPPHFMRIRHFGLLANRGRSAKLARCRQLLVVAAAAATSLLPPKNLETPPACAEHPSSALCPACGVGRLRLLGVLAPQRGIPLCPPRGTPGSLCLPSSPPVTAYSGRLVPLYPRAARQLSRLGLAVLFTACRVADAFPGWGRRPRGGAVRLTPTIGSAPWTR